MKTTPQSEEKRAYRGADETVRVGFTKRDYEMFDRLGTRAQILRNRLAASQLRDTQDITQELHALEWAIKKLQP